MLPDMLACGRRRSVLLAALVLSVALSGPFNAARAEPSSRAGRKRVLPIFLHLAQVDGSAVADEAFIAAQLARANRIFAPYGVGFAIAGRAPLPAPHARMETRADRDALGAYVKPGVIDLFLVQSLRDVDEPERMRKGVHWHSRSHAPAHYVILSAIAPDFVLAHELGHFLGNPRHSDTPDNLMSYEHAGGTLFLDPAQLRRMRRTLARYLERGELRLPDEPARACGAADCAPVVGHPSRAP